LRGRDVTFEKTATRLWRRLPREDRLEASEAFWMEPPTEALGAALVAIVKARRMRPQAARALSDAAKKEALASILDPGDVVVGSLLVALHLKKRREILVAFLDAAKVPHENGLIDEKDTGDPIPDERVKAAVAALKGFPKGQSELYLNILWLQDPGRWGKLPELAETL
jgi:hypothetical protein